MQGDATVGGASSARRCYSRRADTMSWSRAVGEAETRTEERLGVYRQVPSVYQRRCCTYYLSLRRASSTRCSLVRAPALHCTELRCDYNATDRTNQPPEAAEMHTHIVRGVLRYMDLTDPDELVPFGIESVANLVDLVSRVRLHRASFGSFASRPFPA